MVFTRGNAEASGLTSGLNQAQGRIFSIQGVVDFGTSAPDASATSGQIFQDSSDASNSLKASNGQVFVTITPQDGDLLLDQGTGSLRRYASGSWSDVSGGGSSSGLRDLWVGAGAMVPANTQGASAESIEGGSNEVNVDVMSFQGISNDTAAWFSVRMPGDWDRGTLKAKFYWTPGDPAAIVTEFVGWEISAAAVSDEESWDAALGTVQSVTDGVLDDEELHISGATASITVGGSPQVDDLIHFKVSRDFDATGPGDAMEYPAYLLGVALQYEVSGSVTAW